MPTSFRSSDGDEAVTTPRFTASDDRLFFESLPGRMRPVY